MKIAVTGCNGRVGRRVVELALRRGHSVVGIDNIQDQDEPPRPEFTFIQADLKNFEEAKNVLVGSDAVVHLAACPTPGDYGVTTHNRIAELQAKTIVRRYPSMRIASIRLHWSIPHRDIANREDPCERANDLWGYIQEDSGADAFLLAVTNETGGWSGHEAFLIAAPIVAANLDNETLRKRFYPDVPIKDGKSMSGSDGFFDCSKAMRLIGWVHNDELVVEKYQL
ncbi:hypothetical protein H0H93_012785 [Arthromyces matolae]|nr:hypothetical protein H0H93_012785 [Arthromyces matolae]